MSSPTPDDPFLNRLTRERRAVTLMRQGEYAAARREYEELLTATPDNADAHAGLAWLLATCPDAQHRDGDLALLHAHAARAGRAWLWLPNRPTEGRVGHVDREEILAVAHAEAGDFAEAITAVDQVLRESTAPERPRLFHLRRLFAAGKPYRDTPDARDPSAFEGAEEEYLAATFGITGREPAPLPPVGDEAAFVRAVLEAPDGDDVALRMYADWLAERGDARGELIRLSLALEEPGVERERRRPLAARRREILEANRVTWFRPLAALGLHLRSPGPFTLEPWLRRGVLARVVLERAGVLPDRAADLFAAVPLLTEIGFEYPDVAGARLAEVPQLAQVRRLAFGTGALDRPGLESLAASPYLLRVTGLRLSCDDDGLGGGAVEVLAASPLAGRLNSLSLFTPNVLQGMLTALTATTRFTRLTEVSMNGGARQANPTSLQGLADWPGLSRLTALRLWDVGLGAEEVAALAASPRSPRLRILDLHFTELGEEGLAALLKAPWLAGVEELGLAHASLGPGAARALAASPSLAGLRRLYLFGNPIGADGAKALAASPHLGNLERLWVDESYAGAEGMEALRHRFGDVLGAG